LSVVGLIPAGGSGERLGAGRAKALVRLGGKRLVEWSIEALAGPCDRVVVAMPTQSAVGSRQSAEVVLGGASRSASVRNALSAAPEADLVVVHDAARPFVTPALVESCVAALVDGVDGAIAAAPVTDTVKEARADGRVLRTLDRSVLWAVQTPQVFRADVLRRALDVDDATLAAATDDASLIEAAGGTVVVVEAPPENIKVTTPLDLKLAEAMI
jgi:2-C-methyl-D-erythritol 4-phosphate cytidylyltransferase